MEIAMNRAFRIRNWLIVALCAMLGLIMGVVAANALTGGGERYTAQATLAMLPEDNIPLEQAAGFWEVLNRGQATASAAVVLEDNRWLYAAADAAGVPVSGLSLSAGAMPNTTLITVTVEAGSAQVAEGVLESVLTDAVGTAAKVACPFRLETVVPPNGSATSLAPSRLQMVGALGMAGFLVGVGVAILILRSLRERSARKPGATVQPDSSVGAHRTGTNGAPVSAHHAPSMVEISLQ
ncbi:hypothetical protein C6A87_024765 [Mycobacterium sp. ITM-2016-00317]|uniref:hypothetical protein n=1 Tax=Mycobacterium sp. ITM-2016-00317 TaxID=2099694 RepID=UPI00287F7F8E|nr:hypothetical protein [Mycobacterium sp. ITM-2016-00317]WNG86969.1 hypothetical protein C6A87_024765 [Mycobacterium sp. ITM-2016-00317]